MSLHVNFGRCLALFGVACLAASVLEAYADVPDAQWTYPNVAYGTHPKQVMDVWLPEGSVRPVPVVMFIHGGGWTKGARRNDPAAQLLAKCRAAGCAFVAVEYRFLQDARQEGVCPPVRASIGDAAAAIRHVQKCAQEWKIDPKRIGLTGGSAGACSSLACAFAKDCALGIRVVAAAWPQTSLDPQEMRAWIPNIAYGGEAFGYKDFDDWFAHRAESLKWIERFSPAGLVRVCTAAKAPLIFVDPGPHVPEGELPKDPTHAVAFREKLAEICREKGVGFRFVGYPKMHDEMIRVLTADLGQDDAPMPFTVAESGVPKADIVLPAKPLDAERYAADELKHHLDRAFSSSFVIVTEDVFDRTAHPFHIYVGATAAAQAAGLPGRELRKDERIVKTVGNGLFLLGRDSDIAYKDIGNVWNLTLYATIYAVYDFLETELGVRWIWPGPTGEVVPKRATLVLQPIDRTGVEPLEERYFGGLAPWGDEKSGFTNLQSLKDFYAGQSRFLVRHRVGRRRRTASGHSFGGWWKRFGTTHPEYFNLLPGGVRRPASGRDLVTMCVSEPGVWAQKVEDWKVWWAKTGIRCGFEPWVNCCENDFVALCQCAKCRAWDAPDPRFAKSDYWNGKMTLADIDRIHRERGAYGLNAMMNDNRWGIAKDDPALRAIPSLSDRYAKFYNAVQAEVRKVDPAARVVGYAYENYLEPPKETRLDPSVVIEYVPRSYFPYDRAESDYFRAGFLGWRRAGAREFTYRPNYMLAGGNYPFDQGRLILEDFAFAYTNGMTACMFDSLRGSWACHSVMDYALVRAFRDPLHGYDRARREFISAFGGAKREVARYLSAIVRNTAKWTPEEVRRIAWQNHTGGNHGGGSYHNCAAILGDFLDEKFFTDGYAFLDRAVKDAGDDAEVVARVKHLRKGLRDAELTRRTRLAQKEMDAAPGDAAKKAAFEAAFKAMNDYRASVEDDFVCNFWYEARSERKMRWPHADIVNPTRTAPVKRDYEY